MDVTLSPECARIVNAKIRSGRYDSPNDVVQEALRLLDAREEAEYRELQGKIDKGLESLARGERIEGEDAYRQLVEKSLVRRAQLP